MKIKRKGKVYPSPPSSSSYKDAITVLKLLPAAILALALSLPVQDREVLAYMITRSILTTANPPSALQHHHNKKCKRPTNVQKHPLFECGCFDCYTSFWFRWDSSPNRELIHQAIEAFEDHLTHNEFSKRNGRGKKRDKHTEKPSLILGNEPETMTISVPESDAMVDVEAEDVEENGCGSECYEDEKVGQATGDLEMEVLTVQAPASHHKGLARKVLPDVVGLLNSRLWSLWSPNI